MFLFLTSRSLAVITSYLLIKYVANRSPDVNFKQGP